MQSLFQIEIIYKPAKDETIVFSRSIPTPQKGSDTLNQTKLLFPLIFISLEDDSDIIIPPQPTSPDEIMSGGEGELVENEPVEEEAVAPQGTHVTGTQTVTHEYLTLNGKVARETIKTNDSLTAVLDGPMVKRRPPVYILPCSGSGSWMHIGMRSQPRIKIKSSREPAKDETFIFSRFRIYQYIVVSVLHLAEIVFHHALSAHCSHKAHLQR